MTAPALQTAVAAALVLTFLAPPGAAETAAAGVAGTEPDCHEEHGAAPEPAPAAAEVEAVALRIPDARLADQDGRPVRFFSDLVAGRTVAVNFIFTTCTTICPPMGAIFGRLERLLAERGAGEVHLISISVDPVVDTPERLRTWSSLFGRGEGWTLVTGPKPEVDALLRALGSFTADKNDHAPLLLAGNASRDAWRRLYALASPEAIADVLAELRGAEPAAGPRAEGEGR